MSSFGARANVSTEVRRVILHGPGLSRGGSLKRNLGTAAVELYWQNKRHSPCVSRSLLLSACNVHIDAQTYSGRIGAGSSAIPGRSDGALVVALAAWSLTPDSRLTLAVSPARLVRRTGRTRQRVTKIRFSSREQTNSASGMSGGLS